MTWLELWTVAFVAAGVFFFVAGTAGLVRFPDTLSRLHALTKADNLGLGLIVIGLAPRVGGWTDAVKLLVVWVLVLFASAIVSQLIAREVGRTRRR